MLGVMLLTGVRIEIAHVLVRGRQLQLVPSDNGAERVAAQLCPWCNVGQM